MRVSGKSLLLRAGSAAAATAIGGTGIAVTAGAANAAVTHPPKLPTSLSVRVATHPYYHFDVVSGVLKSHRVPLRDELVYLESRPAGSTAKFDVLAKDRTGRYGEADFRVKPATATRYVLVFPGSPNFRAARSAAVTVKSVVTPPRRLATSLSIREVTHPRYHFDVVSGGLVSGRTQLRDKLVYLESRPADSTAKFTVLAKKETGWHGGVDFKVSPSVTTRYELVFPGGAYFAPSHSGVVTAAAGS